jgi:transposase
MTHTDVRYSQAERLMLVAEEAVEIRVLRRQGRSIREIAWMMDLSRNTVRRYLRSEGLPGYEREARPSKLDPYKHYIDERVKAAAPEWIPATVLLRELRALGSAGGYSILKDRAAGEQIQSRRIEGRSRHRQRPGRNLATRDRQRPRARDHRRGPAGAARA